MMRIDLERLEGLGLPGLSPESKEQPTEGSGTFELLLAMLAGQIGQVGQAPLPPPAVSPEMTVTTTGAPQIQTEPTLSFSLIGQAEPEAPKLAPDPTLFAALDESTDAAADAAADGALFALLNQETDAALDGQTDAAVHAAIDTAPNAAIDTAPNAAIDAPVDAAVDTPADVTIDLPVDAAVNTAVDVTIDAPVDAAVITAVDLAPPAGADKASAAQRPQVPETQPVSPVADLGTEPLVPPDTQADDGPELTPRENAGTSPADARAQEPAGMVAPPVHQASHHPTEEMSSRRDEAQPDAAGPTEEADPAASPMADPIGAHAVERLAPNGDWEVSPPAPLEQRLPLREVMAEVVRIAPRLEDGKYQIHLRLHPEHLGEVQVHLIVSGQEVQTHFEVSQPDVRQMLEQQVESLRQGMEQAGLSLSQFHVNTGAGGENARSRWEALAKERGRRTPRREAIGTRAAPLYGRHTERSRRSGGLDRMA